MSSWCVIIKENDYDVVREKESRLVQDYGRRKTKQTFGQFVGSWMLTSHQPHRVTLRTNHTFKIILHQFKTPVTKSEVCLIHCYVVNFF